MDERPKPSNSYKTTRTDSVEPKLLNTDIEKVVCSPKKFECDQESKLHEVYIDLNEIRDCLTGYARVIEFQCHNDDLYKDGSKPLYSFLRSNSASKKPKRQSYLSKLPP